MANPQKEDGYVGIANELAEAFGRTRIPGEASQVLWIIIRKTYGFNKKKDWISLSQFSELTGIKKPNIVRALEKLLKMNIIIKKDNDIIEKDNDIIEKDNKPLTYCLNKDYETWKPLSKKITLSKKIIKVIKKDNASLSKKIHTKDNDTKDNDTKDKPIAQKRKIPDTDHAQVIQYWVENYEKYMGIPYSFNGGKDAKIVQRLLKTYGIEDLKKIMIVLLTSDDEFYRKKAGRTLGVLSACANKLAQETFNQETGLDRLGEGARKMAIGAIPLVEKWRKEENEVKERTDS